jgi:muramoyltetrapeptide carboxypeptidase
MIPQKLKKGDAIQIIAPASSFGIISKECREIANQKLSGLGLKLIFGKHVEEMDEFSSSSIQSRIDDLHEAFQNPEVKMVSPVIGGFNSNQLLRYIDWDLIKNNPKILCGYSDITALNNAIYAKTGLVNYSGMTYADFAEKIGNEFTLDYFMKCVMASDPYEILPSEKWSDDDWYEDQKKRNFIDNPGHLVINEGRAEGTLLGGNLCTLNLLQGTEYFPDIRGSILFIEDDYESKAVNFDRDLQSLIHLPEFSGVKGIAIGRFQKASEMTDGKLIKIIKTKKELDSIPVIANLNFGHTQPMITFPIGGKARMIAEKNSAKIEILEH